MHKISWTIGFCIKKVSLSNGDDFDIWVRSVAMQIVVDWAHSLAYYELQAYVMTLTRYCHVILEKFPQLLGHMKIH
jgi:hypothetical protein